MSSATSFSLLWSERPEWNSTERSTPFACEYASAVAFDAAGFEQWHLFSVAQVGIWFIFKHTLLPTHLGFVATIKGIRLSLARLRRFSTEQIH